MFHHAGKKLKVTAMILAALIAAAGVWAGFQFFISAGQTWPGIGVAAGGLALAWVLGLSLYGFGELIEKAKDNNYLLSRVAAHTKDLHDLNLHG